MKRVACSLLLVLVAGVAVAQSDNLSPALKSMIQTERAFARAAAEKGIRNAFLEYFADDSIGFQPTFGNAKQAILSGPPPAGAGSASLVWKPLFGDVAAAGDIGYLTGPYVYTDKSAGASSSRFGCFFSIWKKQKDGSWKNFIDLGVTTPPRAPCAPGTTFRRAPQQGFARNISTIGREREQSRLLATDGQLMVEGRGSLAKAFLNHASADVRLHRNGMAPMMGQTRVGAFLSRELLTITGAPEYAEVSRSADLGYTYGTYELRKEAATVESGYYVRVWKRRTDGAWKVVLDVTSPALTEQK